MNSILTSAIRPAWVHVASGGLALGTVDLLFAFSFARLVRGASPVRVLQSVAAGLQGRAAFAGGASSALLGLACHYLIATLMVLAYVLAAARWRALVRHPIALGLPYGLWLYVVMTWVVVPLSNAPPPSEIHLSWIVSSLVAHAVFGVICAWSACKVHLV